MAEGGGLLNRYRTKSSIGGSNPPLSASFLWNPLKTCKLMTMQKVTCCRAPDNMCSNFAIFALLPTRKPNKTDSAWLPLKLGTTSLAPELNSQTVESFRSDPAYQFVAATPAGSHSIV